MTSSPSGVPLSSSSVASRGQAIEGWLGQLLVLYIVLTALLLVLMLGVLLFAGQLADSLGGGALLGLSYLPGIIAGVLYIFGLRAARGAIAGVQRFAGQGQTVPTLKADLDRFLTWLTVGQVWAVLGALFSAVLTFLLPGLLPQEDAASAFGTLSAATSGVLGLGMAALNWLILGSVKTFFTAVLRRAQGQPVQVTPAASSAASWLQFTYIVQWIGLVLVGLGLLTSLIPLVALGGSSDSGLGWAVLLILLPVAAFLGWMFSLLLRLVGHSKLFAQEVASVLDRGGPLPSGTQLAPDPWESARP